ncbi:MAG TPA: hypothetical protein VEA37_13450 [Flavobacterium sp.]|nr:hypothetical protein [Flavobacterium sp.]
MDKRSLFDITKEHLKKYPFYKATVKRKQEQNEEINAKLQGISATSYDKERVSGTPMGDLTTTLLAEKMKNEEIIRRINNICKDIEEALTKLPEVEQTIIRRYYLEGPLYKDKRTWVAIAYEVNHAESHCRWLRNKAVEKVSTIFEE